VPANDPVTVVALAVLKPASGKALSPAVRLTAENLASFEPDPAATLEVQRELRKAGFEVGPLVGISMALTGPAELFERFFNTTLDPQADGTWMSVDRRGTRRRELPLAAVPESFSRLLYAMTFEPPAEAVAEDWP
jgi:hypothetical protein